MEINEEKIVKYEEYCSQCRYKDLGENEEPCNECLTWPVNLYSRKPIKFKEGRNTNNESTTNQNLE